MLVSRSSGLIHEVAELAQTLQRQENTDVDAALAELTESAVSAMPRAQHAGITIASRGGKVRTAAATDRYPRLLDEIQQRHKQGPCLSAAWEHHVIRIDDTQLEDRWPAFCREVRQTPIRSIISFQLFADHRTMGALNFYAQQPRAFDEEAAEMGLVLATHTAVAWNMARRDEQFRSALASRDIIGQAKGMIMERFKIDAVQAFELLKRLSQSSNTPLAVVARELVKSEHHG
ncbi:GAF and ANTAR domain-containing protein [Candidatus Mycobacterium methanotrophicum]|uniref:GAF and ANTAR domain-containing protein n=1 Tax=Candidatus Mycobacterium methanotrophicum TaxID=2943498 RepID=A0ABY4QM53_9MYCO|nr:GAF and ANTAR domain-containing protein [Candidatus Mycobacterium methanotrophicum]UQX12102.1 GAF and ANTAR domain-containing protein [Candidatus Mycobacterium methanotrophicum]